MIHDMEPAIYTDLTWIIAIIIGCTSIIVYFGSNNISSRLFSFGLFFVTAWIICEGIFMSSQADNLSLLYIRIAYYIGTLIASSFFLFFLTFPKNNPIRKSTYIYLCLLQTLFFYIFIFTDKIILKTFPSSSPSHWGWSFGKLSYIFDIVFFGFFGLGILILFLKYKKESSKKTKRDLEFMLWIIVIGLLFPAITSVILPRLNVFSFDWLGPISEIFWIPIIAYSILKYKQMDVETVVVEVLGIGMTMLFFINIFLNISTNFYARILIFNLFVILAIPLIRTSLRESRQREMLADLNLNLAQKS